MSDYGIHPTQYGDLNDDALYSMYRESVYSTLNADEKLALLQETVNRDALERGEVGTPLVQFAAMPANESGKAANGVIKINYDMAVNGVQTVEYNERLITHPIDDYNIQALNTVIHENVHCFQDQVIDGTVSIKNDHLTAEYLANDFALSALWQDGSFRIGSQYLTGETPGGYYLYYFQATERDAYLAAEKKTDAILQRITAQYGSEYSFQAYERSVEANGYQATKQEAIRFFQNENFVEDLNQTLQNYHYGTNIAVDVAMEKAVKAEMIESYRHMQEQLDEENRASVQETKEIHFDPNPMSVEEYNQRLENHVCSYQVQDRSFQTEVDNISGQILDSMHNISIDCDNSAAEQDNGIQTGCEDSLGI